MKLLKMSKLAKISLATTFLTSGVLATTIPILVNSNHTKINKSDQTNIQTGNIEHDATAQVVSQASDIIVKELILGSLSSTAIVTTNDVHEIYVWGQNKYGQLGLGHFNDAMVPTKFDLSIFGAYDTIKFVIGDGTKNRPSSYALGESSNIQKLYVWGLNDFGQLGINSTTANNHTPILVPPSILGDYDRIQSYIQDGYSAYVIVVRNNIQLLYATGWNLVGQIGDGTKINAIEFKPIPRSILGNYDSIIQFDARSTSLAIIVERTEQWSLYVWGANSFGTLGLGHTNDVLEPTRNWNSNVDSTNLRVSEIKIFEGVGYLWNKSNDLLYVWGRNETGGTGLGGTAHILQPTLMPASSLGNGTIQKLKFGLSSYAIVIDNGIQKFYVWGFNGASQLGNGTTTNVLTPQLFDLSKVGNPTQVHSFDIATFSANTVYIGTMVVTINNVKRVFVWGRNALGQLGLGHTNSVSIPAEVVLPANSEYVQSEFLSVSYYAVRSNGVLEYYVVGENDRYQLGLGNNVTSSVFSKAVPTVSSNIDVLPKSTKASAHDVFNQFTDKVGSLNKQKLSEYIDFTSLPSTAKLSINSKTKIDSLNGYISLVIDTDSYYVPLSTQPVVAPKQYSLRITGFNKAKDIPIISKNQLNIAPAQFYEKAIVDDLARRSFLEQYLDLTCIPPQANISIVPIDIDNSNKIEFIFNADQVYTNNGETTRSTYAQTFSFTLDKKGLDPIIIIALIAGSCIVLALIFMTIFMTNRRIKYD